MRSNKPMQEPARIEEGQYAPKTGVIRILLRGQQLAARDGRIFHLNDFQPRDPAA